MNASRGFSLMELAVVILIMGIMVAMTVPAMRGYTQGHALSGAAQNIASQLRLAREKAIATHTTQTIRFIGGFQSSDYHIWDGATANPKWSLPNRIGYYTLGTTSSFSMTRDGRCSTSGYVIVQDQRGNRDTVSVQASGLVIN